MQTDPTNESIGSGTDRVFVLFGLILNQICSDRVRLGIQFSSDRVWINFGSTMFGLDSGSAQLEFGSGMFLVLYGSPI